MKRSALLAVLVVVGLVEYLPSADSSAGKLSDHEKNSDSGSSFAFFMVMPDRTDILGLRATLCSISNAAASRSLVVDVVLLTAVADAELISSGSAGDSVKLRVIHLPGFGEEGLRSQIWLFDEYEKGVFVSAGVLIRALLLSKLPEVHVSGSARTGERNLFFVFKPSLSVYAGISKGIATLEPTTPFPLTVWTMSKGAPLETYDTELSVMIYDLIYRDMKESYTGAMMQWYCDLEDSRPADCECLRAGERSELALAKAAQAQPTKNACPPIAQQQQQQQQHECPVCPSSTPPACEVSTPDSKRKVDAGDDAVITREKLDRLEAALEHANNEQNRFAEETSSVVSQLMSEVSRLLDQRGK